jgi:hypothetical protein
MDSLGVIMLAQAKILCSTFVKNSDFDKKFVEIVN